MVPLALEAMQTEHEADRTTSLMMDAVPRPARVADMGDALSRLGEIVRGLQTGPGAHAAQSRFGRRIDHGRGRYAGTGHNLGRQRAHDVVYDAAQAAIVEHRPFSAVLAADPRVTAHLASQAIDKLLDAVAYTGLCAEMAKDAAARARKIAPALLTRG